ncbi:peptidylprolyl isomerase [Candidatus Roizmanbacteria bacterium RIFCSPLOWO2_12_FULL_40_12]|uniref:Peptidyl-prolyl cis-trans isomerase n=1 Tax=Candidatus Roizmanbacteria bacterium RIFCSPLOWO2_01_FULL_40_42 TaxID=1802066 RepID=A0A1F7J4Y0_9BACT|nr:MAG: peptidylprolyl isomerase [Candidatus Roizmanbacteria bacterium RIFCSPHIGHO2_01_FULL_40_98]OGK27407.1 MAG: peptidylprolyl isomerase [Candidatus Roizmanbacteria bacterium RIFCSPHIGHO2_02_FULL_40_53]OGK30885.1 MAG: peptidylprolyl isomerase [Candidatus Roizmanbacteria bacterium RIFCSPHIGHO2_12_41_18]OGK50640.1 MAG: peptidylprolyl isomerase [Candidatus Roizmanbacteria bacterium RIFCSPLOWO2_01_FULL_40_42]OGK58788.1 MAG: peptidylprolyl isomerase [Candidatus Roizmanbacteria bacterium RIFCSPLOWO
MQNEDKLKVEDVKEGTGEAVKKGDIIVIHYSGTLENGQKFDSSYDRDEPFETQIGVGNVIQGWDEGVIGMKIGGKRKLTIPPSMGYGDQATGSIPPNSTLIFDLELLSIKPQ